MEEKTICHCMGVSNKIIADAIDNGAKTLDDVMMQTNAGTVCGGCQPDIEKIIEEMK